MKLFGFPIPEKNELISSVVARHLAKMAGPKGRHLDFLNLHKGGSHSIIPNNLNAFFDLMPSGHPWEKYSVNILKSNSIIPLYLSLSHPIRQKKGFDSLKMGNSKNPSASLGLTINDFNVGNKFCDECVEHDIRSLGYSIFYRQHQPSFVRICAKHLKTLRMYCNSCANSNSRFSAWSMAGQCNCQAPEFALALPEKIPPKDWANWLWLSVQTEYIFEHYEYFENANSPLQLRQALKNKEFSCGNLLNIETISERLHLQFGHHFLSDLGLQTWALPNRLGGTLGRTIDTRILKGDSILNILRGLLLARLAVTNISELAAINAVSDQAGQVIPKGYGSTRRIGHAPIEDKTIKTAIEESNYRVTVAAKILGVRTSAFATLLFKRRIRFPLPSQTLERLGLDLIEKIRTALLEGVPKKEIDEKYGVSEWTRILIELDDHRLNDEHRNSTINKQRQKHRAALIQFLESKLGASRTDFLANLPGSYEWLSSFDGPWLAAALPAKLSGCATAPARSRVDWDLLDDQYATKIKQIRDEELKKTENLSQLTKTRILKKMGIQGKTQGKKVARLPKTMNMIQACIETKECYQQRKIHQALSKFEHAVSILKLRLAAKLDEKILIQQKDFIKQTAREFGLPFHAKCILQKE